MPKNLPLYLLVAVLAGAAFWFTFRAPWFEKRAPTDHDIERMRETVRQVDADRRALLRDAMDRAPDPPPDDPATTADTPLTARAVRRDPALSTYERWIADLADEDKEVVFVATVELGKLRDKRAVPKLLAAVRDHKDLFVRLGAATALGDLGSPDAVPGLIDAVTDADALVRQAAKSSLVKLTGQRFGEPGSSTLEDARAAQAAWRDWWRDHEADVRQRRK